MSYQPHCAICEQPVNLEESKTDEHGHAVHENCYVWTVELKKPGKRKTQMEDPSAIARDDEPTPFLSKGFGGW